MPKHKVVSQKEAVFIVGPNGSGKTTFHGSLISLREWPFLNADQIVAASYKETSVVDWCWVRSRVDAEIEALIKVGSSFVYETVFSHPNKLQLIQYLKERGYVVTLIVVAPKDPIVNIMRVRKRASEGGHDVPIDKILGRRPKTYQNIIAAENIINVLVEVDSSGNSGKPFLIERIQVLM